MTTSRLTILTSTRSKFSISSGSAPCLPCFSPTNTVYQRLVCWNCVCIPKAYVFKVLWTFSIWLESVAILPQLFMLQRTGEADTITTHYLFALGAYRALYIPNWLYRFFVEGRPFEANSTIAGIIQTLLYSDFFYIYYTK